MKHAAIILVLATSATLATAPAEAKGCLKGAAVGGVGGHFVGKSHAVAGAAIGCAVGHHRAKVAARKQAAQGQPHRG